MKGGGLNLIVTCLVVAVGLSLYVGQVQAALGPEEQPPLMRHYYKKMNTCANVEAFVFHQVQLWWNKDNTITAKLLKWLYADCLVNGCDASVFLYGVRVENKAPQNINTLDVITIIHDIKRTVEARCPLVVSCADILNLAVRDALHLAGAPSYPVYLGRRDGLDSRIEWVDLPSPSISWKQGVAYFKSKGLDEQDFATLLGAHTFGKTHCTYIYSRLYNWKNSKKPDPAMSKSTLEKLRKQCPKSRNEDPLVYLNDKNGDRYMFNNTYYNNVVSHDSVLRVDQELIYGQNTSQLVLKYAGSFVRFRRHFVQSITKLGALGVLTGEQGEIRQYCNLPNAGQLPY